jgi:hypothetical protein
MLLDGNWSSGAIYGGTPGDGRGRADRLRFAAACHGDECDPVDRMRLDADADHLILVSGNDPTPYGGQVVDEGTGRHGDDGAIVTALRVAQDPDRYTGSVADEPEEFEQVLWSCAARSGFPGRVQTVLSATPRSTTRS